MDLFSLGEVYFRVTYPDRGRGYPGIESFVYIGKNLSDDDVQDTWYFQFTGDFVRCTSVADAPNKAAVCVTASNVGDLLDADGLARELSAATKRRKRTSRKW